MLRVFRDYLISSFFICTLISSSVEAREPFYTTNIDDSSTAMRAVDPQGSIHSMYTQSHAILIGEVNYKNWTKLLAIRQEVLELRDALERHNFKVEIHFDVPTDEFITVIDKFMRRYGSVPGSRIVVYLAGHGWTHTPIDRPVGYFIPVDVPKEDSDRQAIVSSAFAMSMFEGWAKMPDPRHMLFIFDACFSGSFFGRPSITAPPPDEVGVVSVHNGNQKISTKKRVPEARGLEAGDFVFQAGPRSPGRQFLMAGSQVEITPPNSILTKLLTEILSGRLSGEASNNFDPWITAKELGGWLEANVRSESQIRGVKVVATPVFGSLRDDKYEAGDMVFARLDVNNKYVVKEVRKPSTGATVTSGSPPSLQSTDATESALRKIEPQLTEASKLITAAAFAKVSTEQISKLAAEEARTDNAGTGFDSVDLVESSKERETAAKIAAVAAAKAAEDIAAKTAAEIVRNNSPSASSAEQQKAAVSAVASVKNILGAAELRASALPSQSDLSNLDAQTETKLQEIVNNLSSDDTKRRRDSRKDLTVLLQELPILQREAASDRLVRDLRYKSYRYQLGIATALGSQPDVLKTTHKTNLERELKLAKEYNKDKTLDKVLQAALARI